MKEMTLQKGSIVGVFLLVLLAFVLLLVPGIAAADQVGIISFESLDTCYMVDQGGDIFDPTTVDPEVEVDIFINDNQSGTYPMDIVGILRCQTTITNETGHAINYYGSNTRNCLVYFDPKNNQTVNYTTSWTQTISASGNATLTCQFKKAPK